MEDTPNLTNILLEAITAARGGFAPEGELASAVAAGGNSVMLANLGFDSLACMEFCISIELNTGAELTPDTFMECESLADVAAWIAAWSRS